MLHLNKNYIAFWKAWAYSRYMFTKHSFSKEELNYEVYLRYFNTEYFGKV